MTLNLTKIKSITGRSLSYLFPLIIMILLTGCSLLFEDKIGACETLTNYGGDNFYGCRNDEEEDWCAFSQGGSTAKLWEDKTCINLGYFYDHGDNHWTYDEKRPNEKPGPFGHWGDGTASGTEADADNSGASCGEDDYDGPEFNIQIDSQCKAAFVYRCYGADEAADAACKIYQVWRDQNPSIPECPYCNI